MEEPKYRLTKANLMANEHELKRYQRELLQEQYEQQMQPKKLKGSIYEISSNNIYQAPYPHQQRELENPESYVSDISFPNKRPEYLKMRSEWANELDAQISMKDSIKKINRYSDLDQERELVKRNQSLLEDDIKKEKQFKQTFALEAQENYRAKEQRKRQQRREQDLEKQYYHQRYSVNNLHSEALMANSKQPDPIREYYKRGQQPNTMDTLQEFQPSERKTQALQNVSTDGEYLTQQQKESKTHKDYLRKTLLEQIESEKSRRKQHRVQDFYEPYTNADLKTIDNPIFNPIDIKIAKDNPYILKQLTQRKDHVTPKQQPAGSYLSRQGSSSLLR